VLPFIPKLAEKTWIHGTLQNAPESYRLSCGLKTALCGESTPDAYSFVPLHRHPRHMNGLVTAFRDAVLLAPTVVGPWQRGNPAFDFEAFHATDLHTPAAAGTFAGVHYGYPLESHELVYPW